MKKLLLILNLTIGLNLFSQGLDYDYIGAGNITAVSSWVDQFDGVTPPVDFTTGNFHITNTTAVTLDANWVVDNSIIVENGVNFTIPGTLSITGIVALIDINNTNGLTPGITGTITVTSTAPAPARFLGTQSGGTVIWNSTSSVYPSTYNNLIIASNTKLINNTKTTNLVVNVGNELNLNNKLLTIVGTANCIGTLRGGASALLTSTTVAVPSILINGTGTSTIAFSTGFEVVKSFSVTNTPASIITLNSNLGINNSSSSNFAIVNGTLDISGRSLSVYSRSVTNFGSSTIVSSTASSLSINSTTVGVGALTGTLNFSQVNASIGDFTFNRAGQKYSLTNNLTVTGSCALTSGTLDISGKALTLNGALTIGTASVTSSSTSSLTISGGGAITGSLPITPSISDLTLNSVGQTLTLLNPLNVFNSITPTAGTIATGGNVTLKNSAATKSRLGIVGATGAITGNLTVENYIPGSVAGWRTLGAPGISGLTVASWDGGSGSATDFAMTCSGCNNGPGMAGGGHFVSIQGDAAGTNVAYQELTSANALTPGVGVWVYDGNSLTTAIPVTQTKSGAAVTGNVPATSKFTSNPYACPLSVAAITPVFGVVQYFDPVLMAMTPILAGSIPAGQGFYSANVGTFTEAHKDVTALTTATSIYKLNSTNQTNTNNLGKIFKLKIDGFTGDGDYTYIRLHPNATSSYDSILDAKKMYLTPGYIGTGPTYSQYTSIASVNANQDYCVNSLPDVFTSNLVIPIVAKAQVTGQYTISPIDIQNLPGTACVSLKDKLLNINHDLRAGSYVCNIADTTAKPRFELTICYDPNVVTGINQYENSVNEVLIGQNGTSGAFIKTKFDKTTKSIVSAYNVMGQKVMADKEIEGSENLVYLDFNNVNSQLVIIKVTNDKGQTTKKVFIN